ncbi:MAG: nucleoside triphosphate pyrophosphohydrolase [Clostridia bacterium]|nr:nucleoside triphosphate pyrophosphohydrolase [Clostridia bacterium]
MNFTKKDYTFEDLLDIMKVLRSEGGCPWDIEQTHESIKYCLLEEACEAMESLDKKSPDNFADELGDVLLQVVFHARIAEESGTFSIRNVLNHICTKLISRHTHIFGDDKSSNEKEALDLWEKNKMAEKGLKTQTELMRDVCSYLPALMRAEKVQKKAAKVGFDWENIKGAQDKLAEEAKELQEAISESDLAHAKEELGDLLFSCVNVARFLGVNPEEALHEASNKFINRFEKVETAAALEGKTLSDMTLPEMDAIWDRIKAENKQ